MCCIGFGDCFNWGDSGGAFFFHRVYNLQKFRTRRRRLLCVIDILLRNT
jgi:hypothetical protein